MWARLQWQEGLQRLHGELDITSEMPLTVGRDESHRIRSSDATLSRHHCSIECDPQQGRFYVRALIDLSKTVLPKVTVNGVLVGRNERRYLAVNDIIECPSLRITVAEIGERRPVVEPPPVPEVRKSPPPPPPPPPPDRTSELTAKLAEREAKLAEREAELAECKGKWMALDAELQRLRLEVESERSMSGDADARRRKLEEEIAGLRMRLADAVSARDDAQRRTADLESKVADLSDQVRRYRDKVPVDARRIEDLELELKSAREAGNRLQNEGAALRTERDKLRVACSDMEAKLRSANTQLEQAQKTTTAANQQAAEARRESDRAWSEVKAAEGTIANLREVISEQSLQLNTVTEGLRARQTAIETLKNELVASQQQVTRMQTEQTAVRHRIELAELRGRESLEEVERLRKVLAEQVIDPDVARNLKSLNEDLTAQRVALASMKLERDHLHDVCVQERQRAERLQMRVAELEVQLQRF